MECRGYRYLVGVEWSEVMVEWIGKERDRSRSSVARPGNGMEPEWHDVFAEGAGTLCLTRGMVLEVSSG